MLRTESSCKVNLLNVSESGIKRSLDAEPVITRNGHLCKSPLHHL